MDKQNIGPSMAIIGALLLFIGAIFLISEGIARDLLIGVYTLTWDRISVDPTPIIVSFVMTLTLAILTIIIALIAHKKIKIGGIAIAIIGAFAIIAMFIPIGTLDISSYLYPPGIPLVGGTPVLGEKPILTCNLVATGIANGILLYSVTYILYLGPFLILGGGLLSIFLKE
ncbi:MAG: hypothetical protein JW891_10645 [Candidatus Lokiarchaeota archaeon]|nr:hypothetical protein [Candidatus Lokiarchaeota archaeon]